jgi:hypothetical protein
VILTTTRHGRSARDVRNLKAHLSKELDQVSRVAAIGNVPLSDADSVLAYMEAMRDGSRATVAMHHIAISPLTRMNEAQRDETVRRILGAMGAEDHAWILWEHDGKARTARAADQHFHLVIGHVGPDGLAIDDGHSYARLEAAARSLEHDFGEPLTPSRRTGVVAAILREHGRPDVADCLVAPDEPPRSATSSARRAAAAREGVDLPAAQAAVRAAWATSDAPGAFRVALLEQGFDVVPGTKSGVWLIRAGTVEIGALDRITKLKRVDVAARMKGFEHDPASETSAEPGGGDFPIDPRDPSGREGAPPPSRSSRRGPGHESDRGAEGSPRGGAPEPTPAPPRGRGSEREGRCPRRAAEAIAVHHLRRVPDARLKRLAAELRNVARPVLDRVRALRRLKDPQRELDRHIEVLERCEISPGWGFRP